MDPQWSVIHPRPPMGDRIIPEASHLGQPQEARGSCEWSVQLPNLHREVEKGAGLEGATHYRLSFSSNVMGEYQYLRRTDFAEEVPLGSGSWKKKIEQKKTNTGKSSSQAAPVLLSESPKTLFPHGTGYEDMYVNQEVGLLRCHLSRVRYRGHQTTFTK